MLFQDSQHDICGNPGWENVDSLGDFLLELNPMATALTDTEENQILNLYSQLHDMDKQPLKCTT